MPSSTPASPAAPSFPSFLSAVHATTRCRSFRSVVSPSATATSSADLASGASCLFAKTTIGFPLRCGSRNVRANTSAHSSSLESSLESTTNAMSITYSGLGAYRVRVTTPGLGEFELRLTLDGQAVSQPLPIKIVCAATLFEDADAVDEPAAPVVSESNEVVPFSS